MNFVFKLLLTMNATAWMLVVYGIKNNDVDFFIPKWCCIFFWL